MLHFSLAALIVCFTRECINNGVMNVQTFHSPPYLADAYTIADYDFDGRAVAQAVGWHNSPFIRPQLAELYQLEYETPSDLTDRARAKVLRAELDEYREDAIGNTGLDMCDEQQAEELDGMLCVDDALDWFGGECEA